MFVPEIAQTYAAILNAEITPVVYEFGSLGCSGDLAPLAHCALVAMGEGQARNALGELVEVAPLLAHAGITPVELHEKEGLALINGTDGMLGMLIMAIADLEGLCDAADLATAMSIEGLMGTDSVFRPGTARTASTTCRTGGECCKYLRHPRELPDRE